MPGRRSSLRQYPRRPFQPDGCRHLLVPAHTLGHLCNRSTGLGEWTNPKQYANFRGAGYLFARVRDSLQFRYTRNDDDDDGRVPPSSTSLLDADLPDAPLDRPMSRVYYCVLSGAPLASPMVPMPPVSADATLIASCPGEAGSTAGPT
jgi:hypothetical protein